MSVRDDGSCEAFCPLNKFNDDGSCKLPFFAYSVTQNSYNGSQWWGTISVKNGGPASLTGYTVEFDVPAGAHCTNDAVPSGATLSPLDGTGSSARTLGSHCVFTWPSAALGVNATKTFNYSADSQTISAALNVRPSSVNALACVSESTSTFCKRMSKNCGAVSGVDNCGVSRSVASCGTCASPSTCGGGGNPNVCGVSSGPCSFSITKNVYDGPEWWGTITFKNNGPGTSSNYRVEFDVPAGRHCTNDAVPPGSVLSPLTGSDTSDHTVGNHCVFTWTNAPALAPGASKTFNYSTDTQRFSAAGNVSASDSLCQ